MNIYRKNKNIHDRHRLLSVVEADRGMIVEGDNDAFPFQQITSRIRRRVDLINHLRAPLSGISRRIRSVVELSQNPLANFDWHNQ